MGMGMQEPGEMCCSLANSRIPAEPALRRIGEGGMHAIRIIMAIHCRPATYCMHHF